MKKVVVAMSGGIDSTVAAYLLKKKGYEVIGLTLWLFGEDRKAKNVKKIAQKIGILHHLLDFRTIFKKRVIADFCEQYQKGRTPNPCLRCNQYIKFSDLLFREIEKRFKAEFLATGHYARIKKREEKYFLRRAKDKQKDQSYFLYILNQKQLKHILFPIGNFSKGEVRQIAEQAGLPLNRIESQGICFAEDKDYNEFLKKEGKKAECGLIVDKQGKVLGKHQGIVSYTVGQRKKIGAFGKPMFVLAINAQKNSIVVAEKDEVYQNELIAEQVNWISGKKITAPIVVKARTRYRQNLSTASVFPLTNNKVRVKFKQAQFAVVPGQAVVFYDGELVLGGGIIE